MSAVTTNYEARLRQAKEAVTRELVKNSRVEDFEIAGRIDELTAHGTTSPMRSYGNGPSTSAS